MKKSNSIAGEYLVQGSGRSFVSQQHLEDHQTLVFVTDLYSMEIVSANLAALYYFNSAEDRLPKKENNKYRKIIHPDDYHDFLLHLQSLQDLPPNHEEEITVKVKTSSRNAKRICFRHRVYTGIDGEKKRYVIGIAKEEKIVKRSRTGLTQQSTEKALLKSHRKNKILLEAIKEGYAAIDVLFNADKHAVDYLFLETNAAFETQVKLGHVSERTIKEISPGHEQHWFDIFGRVATTGEPVQFQSFAKDLNQAWFDVHAFPLGETDDHRVGLLISDVTGDKIQEAQLAQENNNQVVQEKLHTEELFENYQLFRSIFNNTTIGLSILKPVYEKNGELTDFVYLRANNLLLDEYPQNVAGQSYLQFNPESINNGVFEAFKRAMLKGEVEDFEIKRAREGRKSWYRITARSENNVLITSTEDISIRKLKASKLKENVRFKKQIAEASPDIIMILNLQKEQVRYINRDMANQPGMRKRDIDGMPISCIIPLIHPHDREKAMDFHTKVTDAENREVLDIEFRFQTSDNHWEWFNARAKVFMRNKENKVCEYILLLRNINQQKETQRALLQAEKLSIKGEVARTLAHELRNPMASIGMAADILSQKTKAKENHEFADYIGVIKRSTKILNKLVTDLLNSSNYTPFKPVKCCLATTLDNALQAAGDRIYLTGVKVIKNYEGTYNILADPEKLKIALLNIIVNASEAMNPDEGVLELKIIRNQNDHILTITDNGCGMEKDQIDKLFDAFYTQKPQGVGIGLNSVKSILEEHDAKILVNSKINEGTSFHLTFHRYESFERT